MKSFEFAFESWILSYLLNSLWQIPLLFAAGWVAARVLRKVSTAAEHRAWVCVLLLQGLLPVFPSLPHDWLQTYWPWGSGASSSGAHVSVVMEAGTVLRTPHLSAALLAAIAIAYCAVSAYFVARFVWRWAKLHTLRREAEEVALTDEAALCWAQCAERFGIGGVSIATSPRVFGPVTMGFSRRLVLLPANMLSGLGQAEMQTLIAHEFAHIRRNDFLKNAIYELLSLPLSYHPLFWLTQQRIMESREMVCDQMAAEIGGRNQYARSLLRLAALLVEGLPVRTPHAIGIFDANLFERRLMKLTEKQTGIRGVRRLAILAACAVFGIATCGSALALSMAVNAQTASDDSGAKTPKVVKVSSGKMAGNLLTKVMPKYPADAKKAHVQGTVVLHAVIGKDGIIKDLSVVSGPEMLQQSSLDAVRQWTYKPYLLNGNPVEVETQINVIYSLGGKLKKNGAIPQPTPPPPNE
jgi:TonB family protein